LRAASGMSQSKRYCGCGVGIPVKTNNIPEGSRTGIPVWSRTSSERSDAGLRIVIDVFGIVN
jgi:hypothetical protein